MSEAFEHPEHAELTSLLRRVRPSELREDVERTFYEAGYAAACQHLGCVDPRESKRSLGGEEVAPRRWKGSGFWSGALAGLVAALLMVVSWDFVGGGDARQDVESRSRLGASPRVAVEEGEEGIGEELEHAKIVASDGTVSGFRIADLFRGEGRTGWWGRGVRTWRSQGTILAPGALSLGGTFDSLMELDATSSRVWESMESEGDVLRVFQGGGKGSGATLLKGRAVAERGWFEWRLVGVVSRGGIRHHDVLCLASGRIG